MLYSSHACLGIASGGAFEYVRSSNSSFETLRSRRIRAAIDVPIPPLFRVMIFMYGISSFLQRASHRADDHATIGALLCAVLTPALFWRRGTTIHREYFLGSVHSLLITCREVVFGGAGLGTAAGYFTHIARSASGDVPPTPVIPHKTS